ncbi:DUF4388 domain-containing protein [Geobacter anodireducens]
MSFTGDLEHLSIVDVIQLLHATRKSGTLTVRGRKGESQLVFSGGYIISANHFDNSVRIGNILVEAGVISREVLDRALLEQQRAGEGRKPLVATLLEWGSVRKEDAYRGLEALIELTVVEILTLRRGTFDLDVNRVTVSDEYRYFPEKLHEEITLHTENVLMDALRIYDEKKRDGLLVEEEFAVGPRTSPAMRPAISASRPTTWGSAPWNGLSGRSPRSFWDWRIAAPPSSARFRNWAQTCPTKNRRSSSPFWAGSGTPRRPVARPLSPPSSSARTTFFPTVSQPSAARRESPSSRPARSRTWPLWRNSFPRGGDKRP